jgi:hypothetical protein
MHSRLNGTPRRDSVARTPRDLANAARACHPARPLRVPAPPRGKRFPRSAWPGKSVSCPRKRFRKRRPTTCSTFDPLHRNPLLSAMPTTRNSHPAHTASTRSQHPANTASTPCQHCLRTRRAPRGNDFRAHAPHATFRIFRIPQMPATAHASSRAQEKAAAALPLDRLRIHNSNPRPYFRLSINPKLPLAHPARAPSAPCPSPLRTCLVTPSPLCRPVSSHRLQSCPRFPRRPNFTLCPRIVPETISARTASRTPHSPFRTPHSSQAAAIG